jgi:hypothetical protein
MDLSWEPKDKTDHGWQVQILNAGTCCRIPNKEVGIPDDAVTKFTYLEPETIIEVTEEAEGIFE